MSTQRHSPSGFITATSLITAQYHEAFLILNTRWQLDTSNVFKALWISKHNGDEVNRQTPVWDP